MRAISLVLVTLFVSGSVAAAQTATAPRIDGEGINMDAPPPPRASQVIQPMGMHRKPRTRLMRRPVRPQRMIASLPIEATRARFQTRPSNLALADLGRLGLIVVALI